MTKTLLTRIISTVVAIAIWGPLALQAQTVYYGFTRLDPVSKTAIPDSYIVVSGTTLRQVGRGRPPQEKNWTYVDMTGRYALPGMFDLHSHITIGPIKVDVRDGAPKLAMRTTDSIIRYSALSCLASGVTTIRNPAGDPEQNARYDAKVRTREWTGPEALHAGFAFDSTSIDGLTFVARTEEEWRREIEREKKLGMRYVKLYAGLDEKAIAIGVRQAHKHGMKTIAHLDRVSWTKAIDLGVDALTHALPTSEALLPASKRAEYVAERATPLSKYMYRWYELVDFDGPEFKNLVQLLAARKIPVDLTLRANELIYVFDQVDSVRPREDRQYDHPALRENWIQTMSASHFGWTEEDYRRAHAVMPKVLELARRFYQASVPLSLGTDGTGGGPDYVRELELHAKAGIPVWDILAMATYKAAENLGVAHRVGRIATGQEADVVFLKGNPLEDLRKIRDVESVVVDGTIHQADALMKEASQLP